MEQSSRDSNIHNRPKFEVYQSEESDSSQDNLNNQGFVDFESQELLIIVDNQNMSISPGYLYKGCVSMCRSKNNPAYP